MSEESEKPKVEEPSKHESQDHHGEKAPDQVDTKEDVKEPQENDVEMKEAHEDAPSNAVSGVTTARTSNASTPAPIELSKSQINSQRRSYFLDQHKSLNKQKLEDSAKRFKYLIGLTDLFRHFINARAKTDPAFKEMLDEMDQEQDSNATDQATDHRHRKTEKEEDAELLIDEEQEGEHTVFESSPPFVENGTMRDYQIQGLNWMISLYENNISGILADEMGLGKTLQTVGFLGYLRYIKGVAGPHIVIVPKSTLDNWNKEFHKWTPEVSTLVLQGDKDSRAQLIQDRLLSCEFDVCITSYEMVLREKHHLKKFAWQYIIVDEAHRIKNEESSLSQIIRVFNSRNRLLVTGTPLQNNLHELWALLNFILPDVFSDSQVFDDWFESQDTDKDTVVQQLHRVLRPFLLRRVKSEVEHTLLPKLEQNVYVGMSAMQKEWYKKLLSKDIDAVNGQVKKGEKTRLLNIVMQLRKCCNHPYLFEGAEPGPPYTTDEHLVDNCQKTAVMDKLLARFKENGDRVLIFSQMSRVLDILEDYCLFRGYKYCRIDGQTAHEDRVAAIDEYNKPGSEKFIFLLTTRAGGLGINLTTANKVILYDSDWNPQADLQAMDRAHRIGQTKQVQVLRFVTEDSVEEKVLERAVRKLKLDQLVIQQGRAQTKTNAANNDDLIDMIQHGAQHVLNNDKSGFSGKISDDYLDQLLSQGQKKTQELNSKYDDLGIDGLTNFSSESAYNWQGEDHSKKQKVVNVVTLGKRARKEKGDYSQDLYYKSKIGGRGPNAKREPKPENYIQVADQQFFPKEFVDLQQRHLAAFRKNLNEEQQEVVFSKYKPDEVKKIKREMKSAKDLTEKELKRMEELREEGFANWTKRDYHAFINATARHGRTNYKDIAEDLEREVADVEAYAKTFWNRYKEIDGYERQIALIKAGEERAKKNLRYKELIREKVESVKAPMQQLHIKHGAGHGKKQFSEEEDRFLIVQMHRFGYDDEALGDLIRDAIRDSPMFRFDWFFLSRSAQEIVRRCHTLAYNIAKELDKKFASQNAPGNRKGGRRSSKRVASEDDSIEDDNEDSVPEEEVEYQDESEGQEHNDNEEHQEDEEVKEEEEEQEEKPEVKEDEQADEESEENARKKRKRSNSKPDTVSVASSNGSSSGRRRSSRRSNA